MPGSHNSNKAKTSSRRNSTADLAGQALKDVQRLYRFLSQHNLDAAKRAAMAIRHGVRLLKQQPGVGRPMADMEHEYREWLIDFGDSGYVALERLAGDRVINLAVGHQRELGY